jgi:glycine/D-amino acid oxidase-like deaminating enzyme
MSVLKASALPADLAGSGWYETLPAPARYPQLEADIRADWLVVGAGFAGLSAALRIARRAPGERVVVLDAQRIAWGAAGRNSGFMIDLPHELNSENYAGSRGKDLQQIAQNRSAIAFARTAAEEFELEAHLSPIGKLHGAADETGVKSLDAFSHHLTALGEPWSGLDAAEMQRVTGSHYYRGGIHTPGALLIHPAAYILGLAKGLAERYSVAVHENTPLLSLATGETPVAKTPQGSVTAPRVILAVNGHIESLSLFKHRLMHIYTYASMTRALSREEQQRLGGEPEWGLIPAHPMGSTVRRLKCNRVVVRNVFTGNPKLSTNEDQVREIGRVHDRSFAARFPMLRDVAMEYHWGGHLCLSRNSVPAFGEVAKGVFAAACQNGLGTTKGTLSGILAADLASGVDSDLLRQWQSQDPPKKLFPEPLMSLGARAYLKWVQSRAGLDL